MHWEVLPHPAYSPDLAPNDFHLFGPLKEAVGCIMKLPERWQRCIEVRGEYVESYVLLS
jgi:hypothetical protein